MPQPARQIASAQQADALQQFAEQQEFAFAEVAPDGRLRTLNPFARLCWGWNEAESIPEDLRFVLEGLPDDASEVLPIQRGGLTMTGIRRGRDGGWMIVGYEPVRDPSPNREADSFDALVGKMPVIVLRMQTDGTVLFANSDTERQTGFTRDEIVGTRFWSRILLPEYAASFDDALREVARKRASQLDFAYRTNDGRVRQAVIHLFFSDGYEIEAVILDRTTSSRPGTDQDAGAMMAALDQGPEGFIFVDAGGVVRYANHRVRELIGIAAVDAWMDRLVQEAVGFDPSGAEAIRRCLRDGDVARRLEASFMSSSGIERVVLMSISRAIVDGRKVGCAVQLRLAIDGERAEDLRTRYRDAVLRLREIATASPDESVFLDSVCRIMGETAAADRVRLVSSGVSGDRPADAAIWSSAGESVRSTGEQDREILFVVGDTGELYIGPDPSFEANALAEVLDVEEAMWLRLRTSNGDAYLAIERLMHGEEGRPAWAAKERAQMTKYAEAVESLWSWIELGSRYRRLTEIIEDVPFSFVLNDAGSRRYLQMGDRIEEWTGLASRSWTSGPQGGPDWVEEFVHHEDRSSLRAHDRVLEQGVASTSTYRLVHRDGSERWVAERAQPTDGWGGTIVVNGILTDVTDRHVTESRLVDSMASAETSGRQRTSFIATLSHEVRTPIGAIQGYAELLSRELAEWERRGAEIPTAIREFVSGIDDRSKRLTLLVQDLFDLSAIEMGQATVSRSPVVLHDIVKRSASKMTALLREKGITMRLQLDSRDPKVLSDPRRLEQIIDGLVSNAVKFTTEGTVTVRTESRKREVVIEVIDTGIGIAEAYQDQLFMPFTQEDNWRNRRFDGTGLGLSLVKRLLDLLGGRIEVESRKDVGSTFRVILPAVRGTVSRGVSLPRAERK